MEKKNSNRFNLDGIKKEDLFAVPENYFEELPQKIQKRILQQENRAWYTHLLAQPAFRYASVLSVFLLIFGSIYFLPNHNTPEIKESSELSAVSANEIYEYLEDNFYSLDMDFNDLAEEEATLNGQISMNYEEELLEQTDPFELQEIITEL